MKFSISLEKRYGRILENPSLLDRVLSRAAKAGAEKYTEAVHDWIDRGRAFTPRTGNLQGSISWRGLEGGAAEVSAGAKYAPFVEFGTRAHRILPRKRKFLRFFRLGKEVETKEVFHPGTRPRPFFFINMSRRTLLVKRAMEGVLAEELGRRE